MLRLLRFLWTGDGHMHRWEPYGKETKYFLRDSDALPVRSYQPVRCAVCGRISSFNIR